MVPPGAGCEHVSMRATLRPRRAGCISLTGQPWRFITPRQRGSGNGSARFVAATICCATVSRTPSWAFACGEDAALKPRSQEAGPGACVRTPGDEHEEKNVRSHQNRRQAIPRCRRGQAAGREGRRRARRHRPVRRSAGGRRRYAHARHADGRGRHRRGRGASSRRAARRSSPSRSAGARIRGASAATARNSRWCGSPRSSPTARSPRRRRRRGRSARQKAGAASDRAMRRQ